MPLDSRILLAGQAPDFAGSLLKGVEVADAIMGRGKGMTPYQRESLDLQRARLQHDMARGGAGLTPYQARSLELRERALSAPKQVSAVEGIRRKVAAGETLTPGEQKVYDDATRLSAFDRILLGAGAETDAPAPRPQSMGPLTFETNPNRRQVGQVYTLPNGKQGLWSKDAQGRTGWEVID